MGLMYNSATERVVPLTELKALPTPDHGSGRFHRPYPFFDYVEDVKEALDGQSIVVRSEEHVVNKDNSKYFGLLEVGPKKGEYISADDWKLLVGLRGSHDQSISRGLVIGGQVTVCSNLMFVGDVAKLKTKQTLFMPERIGGLISESVQMIPEVAQQIDGEYSSMKDFELKPHIGDAALIQIYRLGGLSGSQLGRAIAEWDEPSYDDHADYGYSAWRLLNACTQAVKPARNNTSSGVIYDKTVATHGYITNTLMKRKGGRLN